MLPLLRVLEVSFVVSVPGLPVRRADPHVLHQGLEGGGHLRLVDYLVVHAPRPLHHADGVFAPAVAGLLPPVDRNKYINIYIQPKKQFKVQIIVILEEKETFY